MTKSLIELQMPQADFPAPVLANPLLAAVLVRENETVRSCDRICDLCGGKVDKEDNFIDEEHCENCGWS